jgi:endonuclease/exonuclease/phosphatase (EEP) superfamily protein YafD
MALLRWLGRTALVLAVIGVVVLSLAPLLWPIIPRATMLAPMAMQFAAASAAVGALAVALRRRLLAVLAFLALGWNLLSIWPDVYFSAAADAGQPLTVMSFNLWYKNQDVGAVVDVLAASGADVIGLVEVTPRLKAGLAPLRQFYPYGVDCVGQPVPCETMMLSKYPLKNAHAGPIDGDFPHIAIAEIDRPNASPVTVVVTHLSWPFVERLRPALVATTLDKPDHALSDTPDLEQSVQAGRLAAFLVQQPDDLVLMGDFNAASWSPLLVSLRASTGLTEYRALRPSWPSWASPIFRIPIDHVFARGRARVVDTMLGPPAGSDHLPIIAKIAVAP